MKNLCIQNFASEAQVNERIRSLYEETGYVIDTHTAVASYVYEQYKEETKDERKTVIASTASPYKFMKSVMCAIDQEINSSFPPAIAIFLNLRLPSEIALKNAVRSAQFVGPYAEKNGNCIYGKSI